jgi:deoxyguanosine kinase
VSGLDAPGAPRWIVVEGPIGVGKTTLARRLADSLGAELTLEDAEANPFLAPFYREGGRHALPAQLFFLLQRLRQQGDLGTGDLLETPHVSDYLLDKDRLFAELTLTDEELALYDQIHGQLELPDHVPDLVVYLQAPVPVLLERIRRRDIPAEAAIRAEYLERLNEAYTAYFHAYDRSPLLIVNAARIDWVHRDDHYEGLLREIREMRGLRRYYNPDPELI